MPRMRASSVRAGDVGLTGRELPEELEARPDILGRLAEIRVRASLAMGIAKTEEEARAIRVVPFVGFVSAPAEAPTLTGELIRGDQIDLAARVISNGQPHRALPLTISLCTAVAARIEGTVVAAVLPLGTSGEGRLRLVCRRECLPWRPRWRGRRTAPGRHEADHSTALPARSSAARCMSRRCSRACRNMSVCTKIRGSRREEIGWTPSLAVLPRRRRDSSHHSPLASPWMTSPPRSWSAPSS